MDDRVNDPDDLIEARRIAERLGLDDDALPQILDEIRGGAARRARERYLADGAANDGLAWYPGIWRRRDKESGD